MKKIILSLAVTLFSIASISAQKFGHVNSSQLLLSMPEVKNADAQLQAFQKDLMVKGEQMVKKFETNYNAYMEKANSGELSQIQMQTKEAELTNEQQAIQKYEVEVQQKIAEKKQQIYQPILDRVQEMIKTIGKEQGYTMIFDTSMGGLLFSKESEDLMPMLKTKLGI